MNVLRMRNIFLAAFLSISAVPAQAGQEGYLAGCARVLSEYYDYYIGQTLNPEPIIEDSEAVVAMKELLDKEQFEMWVDDSKFAVLFKNADLSEKKTVTDYCVRDIDSFNQIETRILDCIMKHDSDAALIFARLIVKNFDKLRKYTPDVGEHDDDLGVLYAKKLDIMNAPLTIDFLCTIMHHNHDTAKIFMPMVVKHFCEMNGNVIEKMIECDPQSAATFKALALEHFDKIDNSILNVILKHDQTVADECFEKIDVKLAALLKAKNPLIQSVAHIRKNKKAIICAYKSRSALRAHKKFIRKVLKKERELAHQGYFTAYHAQSSDKFVPILLDTFLYGLRTQQNVENFLLMHTKKNPIYEAIKQIPKKGLSSATYCAQCSKMKQALLQKQAKRRQGLLNGRKENKDRRKFLFLNDSLFGNIEMYGSNSFPHYFYQNYNTGGSGAINNKIEEIFEYHGLQRYVSEFSQEINELYQEYIEISKYGTLYLLGIPKKNIKKNVVFVATGGFQDQCILKEEPLDPTYKDGALGTTCKRITTDMDEIAQALVTEEYVHQKDQKEYVGVMTYDKDGLLNPESGLKVFPFIIPTDEKRYQEWQAKWKDLTARLAQHIERERSQIWGLS